MKYIKVEESFGGGYELFFTNEFYKVFSPYYNHKNSYFNMMFKVFGLLPQDFYHYVGSNYGASFRPHKYVKKHITMFWEDKKKATLFAQEVDKRITYFARQL